MPREDLSPILSPDSPARCLGCRYPLRDLTVNRCPECGREFDPNDPATMYVRLAPGPTAVWFMTPPGLFFHSCVVIAALLLLFSESFPGGLLAAALPGGCGLLILGAVWTLRLLCSIVLAWRFDDPLFHRLRTWRSWLTAPVLVVVLWILVGHQVPLRLAFHYSREAMDRAAQDLMKLPVNTPDIPNRRLGWYFTDKIRRLDGGVLFQVGGGAPWIAGGFAYHPDGPPPSEAWGLFYFHLEGPWYKYAKAWS
jgi:hypothetical protein